MKGEAESLCDFCFAAVDIPTPRPALYSVLVLVVKNDGNISSESRKRSTSISTRSVASPSSIFFSPSPSFRHSTLRNSTLDNGTDDDASERVRTSATREDRQEPSTSSATQRLSHPWHASSRTEVMYSYVYCHKHNFPLAVPAAIQSMVG
jgi:hypothetical protein